jgi:hypothetical protein
MVLGAELSLISRNIAENKIHKSPLLKPIPNANRVLLAVPRLLLMLLASGPPNSVLEERLSKLFAMSEIDRKPFQNPIANAK